MGICKTASTSGDDADTQQIEKFAQNYFLELMWQVILKGESCAFSHSWVFGLVCLGCVMGFSLQGHLLFTSTWS